MNIILIGFMGSGKSSVAKYLSSLLSFSPVEMDDLVCQKNQTQSMHEVFAKGGELLLRETEIAIAKEYAPKKRLVVSTGGGVVLNKIILDTFKAHGGKVFFLQTSLAQIVKRLEADRSRPLFEQPEEIKKLYTFRQSLYLHYADEIIETDLRPADAIAQQIQETLFHKGWLHGL